MHTSWVTHLGNIEETFIVYTEDAEIQINEWNEYEDILKLFLFNMHTIGKTESKLDYISGGKHFININVKLFTQFSDYIVTLSFLI